MHIRAIVPIQETKYFSNWMWLCTGVLRLVTKYYSYDVFFPSKVVVIVCCIRLTTMQHKLSRKENF